MEYKEDHLIIYADRSILYEGELENTFIEGRPSELAIKRLENIRKGFSDGFLEEIIQDSSKPDILHKYSIEEGHKNLLENLVNFTSELGRALIGLTILQLAVKSIEPSQNIRLHKASVNRSYFSWREGIPMRVLDVAFITPVLRNHKLLSLNKDGIMMTRTLAENYPYSKLYKAGIKGAKLQWMEVMDLIETQQLDPKTALYHTIALLRNKSLNFKVLTAETKKNLDTYFKENVTNLKSTINLIKNFVDNSSFSARLFEVSMHGLMQVLEEENALQGRLKPLTQMRSANKKHGNIGDVEILVPNSEIAILEAWDAKYGKPYLREELEELAEKLELHSETEIAGFVVNSTPDLKKEIANRIEELNEQYNTKIYILDFEEWVNHQIGRAEFQNFEESILSNRWLTAILETLSQERRGIAPIDEPCDEWVAEFNEIIKNIIK